LLEEPQLLTNLWERTKQYSEGLKRIGIKTFGSVTPIVPIACRDEEETLAMTKFCRDAGLFVVPVFYPAVPMNAPRLRTCVMASHTKADIDFALRAIEHAALQVELRDKANFNDKQGGTLSSICCESPTSKLTARNTSEFVVIGSPKNIK
jgi:hypothetical protein